MSMHDSFHASQGTGCGQLFDVFRHGYYQCLTRRADTLFELTDALLCAQGNVADLAHLSLEPEHHRGYGALYDTMNRGRIDLDAPRARIGALPVAKMPVPGGRERTVLAVDVSNWLGPDAACSPERAFSHSYARNGQAQMVPGWPYSFVAALEPGTTSWTALLDVVRLRPGDDATLVTATGLREVADRLIAAGQQQASDPEILVVMDAGYDVTRLAWLLRDLPVILAARIRSDRVFYAPAGERRGPTMGRPPRHGAKLVLRDPATHPAPACATEHELDRYGHGAIRRVRTHAPQARIPRRLQGPPGTPAPGRGHRDQPEGRAPAKGTATPSPYGCGCRNRLPTKGRKWITGGRCTFAASISNTPSAS